MLILGTSKDYYDYVVKDRGLDSYVVFNRGKTLEFSDFHEWIIENSLGNANKTFACWLLLVGFKAYVFKYNIPLRKNTFHYAYDIPDRKIIKRWKDRKIDVEIDKPIYVVTCYVCGTKSGRKYIDSATGIFSNDIYSVDFHNRAWRKDKKYPFYLENPNLKLLGIPALISAEEIWDNIYNYLLLKKEPPEPEPVPDEIKLHSHGFDNASFKGKLRRKK
ncbi:MAG: hypothetical protein LBC75_08880 [Fibromonadaceae bacterium]|jgi:hypothetical protein|nr:hypothetical protein [Fibromonadaceae bacterium]